MALKVTPAEFAEKQSRRLIGALDDMRKGVEKVTESPTLKAANKKDKMKARLVAAIDNGKWSDGLKRVTLEEWKEKMGTKGVNRVAEGITGAREKVEAFASQLLPAVEAARNKIASMPDLTLEDSLSRMQTYIREMAKFRKK
jgi:hypothetical protein